MHTETSASNIIDLCENKRMEVLGKLASFRNVLKGACVFVREREGGGGEGEFFQTINQFGYI